ncbi:MAG: aminotransferase class I/II-fold pyridoxal phosphate-dependent enzyme, partial [Candidatus Zixiibacteriota bacterium]
MPLKKVVIEKANRLFQLPPPLFTSIHKKRDKTLIRKTDILNFTRFSWPAKASPDLNVTPESIEPASETKISTLKEELSGWFEKQHGVKLDSEKEIFVGGGIRNLLLNIGLAFIDRNELAFVPELGYPHFRRVVAACGGEDVSYPNSVKSDWLPDFSKVSSPIGRIARLLFLNSPHNPTGAVLNEKELSKLAAIASKENVMIINDATYQSLCGTESPSLLAIDGGTKIGAETHSFSYTFGLPSLPVGFVAGHPEIINGLKQLEQLSPQPVPDFYCELAIEAIRRFPNTELKSARRQVTDSRTEAMKLLDVLELEESGYNTVPFLWGKIKS